MSDEESLNKALPTEGSSPYIDPLTEIIAKWRWRPVTPLDEPSARRVGGAYFQYLFGRATTHEPANPEEELLFKYLEKRFADVGEEPQTINVTAEEIAAVLRLSQAASLTKAALRSSGDSEHVSTADIAPDSLLEEMYWILNENSSNNEFIEEIDRRLNSTDNSEQTDIS